MWWCRLTDVRFQSPWNLSDYCVLVEAQTKKEASALINQVAMDFCEEYHRLSEIIKDVLGPFPSKKAAQDAARNAHRERMAHKAKEDLPVPTCIVIA